MKMPKVGAGHVFDMPDLEGHTKKFGYIIVYEEKLFAAYFTYITLFQL